jgi:Immunoglobulin domain/LVIVD repeat
MNRHQGNLFPSDLGDLVPQWLFLFFAMFSGPTLGHGNESTPLTGLELRPLFVGAAPYESLLHSSSNLYWLGRSNHFTAVDLSIPTVPILRCTDTNLAFPMSLETHGSIGFFGGESLHIVDISDLSKPHLLATLDEAGKAFRMRLMGSALYVFQQSQKLVIVDVSDPTQPRVRHCVAIRSVLPPTVAEDWFAFMPYGDPASTDLSSTRVELWDTKDPFNPKLSSTIVIPEVSYGLYGAASYLAHEGHSLLAAVGTNIYRYSVEHLSAPQFVSSNRVVQSAVLVIPQGEGLFCLGGGGNLFFYRWSENGGLQQGSSLNLSPSGGPAWGESNFAGSGDEVVVSTESAALCSIRPNTYPPLQLLQQPLGNVRIPRGEPFNLECLVESEVPVAYQWFQDGVPQIAQTNRVLRISQAERGNRGRYRVVASTAGGSIGSALANVYVEVPLRLLSPLLHSDGIVEIPFTTVDGRVPLNSIFDLEVSNDLTPGSWTSFMVFPSRQEGELLWVTLPWRDPLLLPAGAQPQRRRFFRISGDPILYP